MESLQSRACLRLASYRYIARKSALWIRASACLMTPDFQHRTPLPGAPTMSISDTTVTVRGQTFDIALKQDLKGRWHATTPAFPHIVGAGERAYDAMNQLAQGIAMIFSEREA